MRELTLDELELVAGGYVTDGYGGGDSGGDIVVTAPDGDGGDYGDFGDFGDYGDYGDGGYTDGGGGDAGPTPGTGYPAGFDPAVDDAADALAAQVAAQIAAMPDIDKIEYGAIIWKDSAGALHNTTIAQGSTNATPLDGIWGQVDFANGGQVVAIMHSHPSLYNAGSVEAPNWQPATQSGTLSSTDFDQLMNYGSGAATGFDSANYRSYLVTGGDVKEYYAFQQDASMIGAGAQATWAVPSTDYGQ